MARRMGNKRRKVTLAEMPMVTDRPADRRATDLLRNAQVAVTVVDDPYALERGDKITALRSLRDDPLERLHIRNMIDDAQRDAGKAYRKDLELAEFGGAKAVDPTKEAVDGGGIVPDPFSEARVKATDRLIKAGQVVGLFAESILRAVFAENLFPGQVAVARGFTGKREQDHYAWIFRKALEQLAVFYGTTRRMSNARVNDPMAVVRT